MTKNTWYTLKKSSRSSKSKPWSPPPPPLPEPHQPRWWSVEKKLVWSRVNWILPPRQGPRFSIRTFFGIFCSDDVFVQLNQYSQILRRQCCLPPSKFPLCTLLEPLCKISMSRHSASWANVKTNIFSERMCFKQRNRFSCKRCFKQSLPREAQS